MATATGLPESQTLRFRTGAAMPSRLGSQQLKDEITAVLELVKNAYDADATIVRVEFRDGPDGQAFLIRDDGGGMSLEDLHNKWAWLATENKVRESRSTVFHRRVLGQKGVGRFAAEKLGKELVLRTRTEGQAGVWQVKFDWDAFSPERELSDYEFPVKEKKPEDFEPRHGTTLEIKRLRVRWKKPLLEKLRSQLCMLIDPESGVTDFKILFLSPWQELNGTLANPLPGNETHSLQFELSDDGTEKVEISSPEGEQKSQTIREEPVFGPVRGRLRYFGNGLKGTERGRGGDPNADWNVGIRIFRDGCRVRPYGEPGPEGDWLQIYQTRYQRGSRFRLKPHYLEGSIHITTDSNPGLSDTTSREGLEGNDSFLAFREYVGEKVVQLSELLREDELRAERARMKARYEHALDPLTKGLNQLKSEQYRTAVNDADKRVRRAIEAAPVLPVVRNAHWECLDCSDSWKVPRDLTPTHCREYSVGRDGQPSGKPGCGSTNIRRKENVDRDQRSRPRVEQALDDVLKGVPAYVSGIQLTPKIDWEMGERDDEAEVRPEDRELAINGRHPAFRAADLLDGNETVEGTPLEALRAVAALTVHVIDAAALAWARWHFFMSGNQFEEYLARYAELKAACLGHVSVAKNEAESTSSSPS